MKKNQKRILVVLVVLTLLYLLWEFVIKKSQWYLDFLRSRNDGDIVAEIEEGQIYAPGCQYPGYNESDAVLLDHPSQNLNKCGQRMKEFQQALNVLDTGCNLVEDGAFGPLSVTCHTNVLDMMGGEWVANENGVIINNYNPEATISDNDACDFTSCVDGGATTENTQQSGVDAQGNYWYIDQYSGALIYL